MPGPQLCPGPRILSEDTERARAWGWREQEEWIFFGSCSRHLQPFWNLNDFLPLNSPGACFFPHPERFSHSFPAGYRTPAHKAQPCPVHGWSPGLPAVVAIPIWATGAGTLTWEGAGPPCWWAPAVSLLACCPCYPCGPFFHPGMPIAVYTGAPPASLSLLPILLPSPIVLSPVPLGTDLAFG